MATNSSAPDPMHVSRIIAYSTGAVVLIAGLVLLFWPDRTITVVARITGIFVVIVGVSDLVDTFQQRRGGYYGTLLAIRGVINVGFGLVLVFWPHITVSALVWIFGISLVLSGVLGLIVLRSIPKEFHQATIIRALVTIGFGLVVMIWPGATANALAFIAGALLLALGLTLLGSGYLLSKADQTIS